VRTPRRRITKMLSLTRLLSAGLLRVGLLRVGLLRVGLLRVGLLRVGLLRICLLCIWIGAATTAHAGSQLFEASWSIKAFGNECVQSMMNQGPNCPNNETRPEFEFYEAYRMPQGLLCNRYQPRCPFDSTPTDGSGNFAVLGGSVFNVLHCAPWANWGSSGTTVRPAKGATAQVTGGGATPPLYRNQAFFTAGGEPDTYNCLGSSSDGYGGPGLVQRGQPVTGLWSATTTGTQLGGFNFSAAASPPLPGIIRGVRTTGQVGEFGPVYPYIYSYTYATVRNDLGVFAPAYGPGSFDIADAQGGVVANRITVKQGAAQFGGTMQMLGALTAKACYYWQQGCSLGQGVDWRYEAVGASGVMTNASGVVTAGYAVNTVALYYHTALMQTSTVNIDGSRFPWTTGSVTITAAGRGPHVTIHYAHGYDNRNATTPNGMGTIQLVSPLLTRWRQVGLAIDTGGIGILRIEFLPEPQAWVMLVVGASMIGVGARMRRH
jgi:hypothetical protein